MTIPLPPDVATRRQQFFDYFRHRLDTARRADLPEPDKLFLLSGCLDALARHWHATADRATTPADVKAHDRMRMFLVQHGGHPAFEKISAPMFRDETGLEVGTFPFEAYQPNQMNQTRTWRDDPNLRDAELVVAVADRAKLLRWSYGAMLYVDFRCAWVHKFLPENKYMEVREADFYGGAEPYYRYMAGGFQLAIPALFLLATLERAIESFDNEASAQNRLPFTV